MLTCIFVAGAYWLEAVSADDTRAFMRPENVIALSLRESGWTTDTRIRMMSDNDFYIPMDIHDAFAVVSTCKDTPIPD